MREIKFRAWDKINKRWIKRFNIDLLSIDVSELPNIELMQYTGLKDANGKEIYEGDIISFGDNKAVVFYEHAKFRAKYKMCTNGYCIEDLSEVLYFDKVKIIGNIYENKELLRGEE